MAAVPEIKIHIAILDYLRAVLPDALVWHTPNGGARNISEAKSLKRMGVLPGVPDIIVITRAGKALFIEVKTARGKLSLEQSSFRDFCVAAGLPWALCRSVDDAREFLNLCVVKTREAA